MVSLYRWHQFWRVINKLLQPLPSGRPPAAEGVLQLSARKASHINTQQSSYFNGKLCGANCTSDLRLIWYRSRVQIPAPEIGNSEALHVFPQLPHASAGITIIIILPCYSLSLFFFILKMILVFPPLFRLPITLLHSGGTRKPIVRPNLSILSGIRQTWSCLFPWRHTGGVDLQTHLFLISVRTEVSSKYQAPAFYSGGKNLGT